MATKSTAAPKFGLGINFTEKAYRQLVEYSPMPMAVHIKGVVAYINTAAVQLMGGKNAKEFLDTNVLQYVHPDSQPVVIERMKMIYKEGRQHTDIIEEKLVRANGEVINVEIASLLFMFNGEPAVQLMLRDISERYRAQADLQQSEQRFRELADSMPQMVWATGPDGTINYRNKKWCEYTGFDPMDETSQHWDTMMHADDQETARTLWQEALLSGEPAQMEVRLKDYHQPGKFRWFLVRAVPVKDSKGNITKWYGTSTDIDNVRRTNQRKKELEKIAIALKEQRSQLVALNRAKDEFIALASHQLRTPATGVKQFIGMVLEGFAGELSSDMRLFLERAYDSNERQIAIINDLLNVAQVDAGKVSLEKQTVDVVKLIQNVIDEQSPHFSVRRQVVTFSPPREPLLVQADGPRLQMVLDNIIDNASKYTPHGKSIDISVTKSRQRITIAVHDEGVGIDPADIGAIFKKFSRLDNPLSAHVGGSGLGLYWVEKIISLHDGRVMVDSAPGSGSTFTIVLPA